MDIFISTVYLKLPAAAEERLIGMDIIIRTVYLKLPAAAA